MDDKTQTHRTLTTSPPRLASKPRFNAEKTVEALLEDANHGQQRLMETYVAAVRVAIFIGQALMKLKALLRHGEYQRFIIEHFCKPHKRKCSHN